MYYLYFDVIFVNFHCFVLYHLIWREFLQLKDLLISHRSANIALIILSRSQFIIQLWGFVLEVFPHYYVCKFPVIIVIGEVLGCWLTRVCLQCLKCCLVIFEGFEAIFAEILPFHVRNYQFVRPGRQKLLEVQNSQLVRVDSRPTSVKHLQPSSTFNFIIRSQVHRLCIY